MAESGDRIDELHQLLQRAEGGDATALDQLLAAERDSLCQFVGLRFDERLRARLDPSDIVQETQIDAVRRFARFCEQRPMPFHVWLRKNALERVRKAQRDHLGAAKRSISRERAMPERSSLLIAEQMITAENSPSAAAIREEFRAEVIRILDKLPEMDQEVMLMRHVEGFAHREIAYLLEIEESTARKRYARALLRLQDALGDRRVEWPDS